MALSVRVTSPARTIADSFKFRRRVGLDVAIEALRAAWDSRAVTMDGLWAAAAQTRMTNVMRPYDGITVMSATNLAASVRARLRNLAERDRVDFGSVLTRYGLERMLYRVSVGEHSGQRFRVTYVQRRERSLNLASWVWSQRSVGLCGERAACRAKVVKQGQLRVQRQERQCVDSTVVSRLDDLLIQGR